MPNFEARNQSFGLIEVFRKTTEPVPVAAGSGLKPPSVITAVAMGEPENSRTPIPSAFIDAFKNPSVLRGHEDKMYDLEMDRLLFWALDQVDVQALPGFGKFLTEFDDVITGKPEPVSQKGLNRFMLSAYDAGYIKPQNWREKITLPVRFAVMRHRAKIAAR